MGQITNDGYDYDGVGNLTAAPGQTFTYNGAQQLTSSTQDGVETHCEYARADMNKLLRQSTDGGAEYEYAYGTTDSNGVPLVTGRTITGTGTASVISDPSTGQALGLRTTDGVTTMWMVEGIGNPTAAIADTGHTAYSVSYAPYGVETVNSGGGTAQWQQNPHGFKAGLRSSSTDNGLSKFGYRWQSSITGGWIERDTLDVPLSPTNATRYAHAASDPVNLSDPAGRSAGGAAVSGVVNGIGALGTAVACATLAVVGCIAAGIGLGIAFGDAGGIASEAVDGGSNYGAAAGEGAIEGGISAAIGGIGGGSSSRSFLRDTDIMVAFWIALVSAFVMLAVAAPLFIQSMRLAIGKRTGVFVNPHVFFGIFGIIAITVGLFVALFPRIARAGLLKQGFLPNETADRLYSTALVRFIGLGQVVVGIALTVQWIVFT